ncbi:hypothetical protein K2D_02220 [Planctomycetes bacterium K2D]|nr:hypothetical protein K2D_02220 [Planctomycetes bacterium K2D]
MKASDLRPIPAMVAGAAREPKRVSLLHHLANSMGKTVPEGAGKPPRVPACCLHKPTEQAFVRVAGKFVYLGAYGSENCDRQPKRVLAHSW